jgi:outer membrane protein
MTSASNGPGALQRAARHALGGLGLLAVLGLTGAAGVGEVRAQTAFENRFTGEVGVGAYLKRGMVKDVGGSVMVLPYVYGDYGRFFARVDTLGVKTLPLGTGHLELVARISTDGFDADGPALRGVGDRRNPVPIGVGTMQRTAVGAFFLYAMYDVTSGGALLEGTWGGRFEAGPVTLYPLLGLEYRSSAFVSHLYGIDAAQSAASGYPAYAPGGSIVPMAGLAATVPISGPWALQFQWRHRWFDDAITGSPIVNERGLDSGHVALTYEFK